MKQVLLLKEILGTNDKQVENLKMVLKQNLKMKDMGLISDFLGINMSGYK